MDEAQPTLYSLLPRQIGCEIHSGKGDAELGSDRAGLACMVVRVAAPLRPDYGPLNTGPRPGLGQGVAASTDVEATDGAVPCNTKLAPTFGALRTANTAIFLTSVTRLGYARVGAVR